MVIPSYRKKCQKLYIMHEEIPPPDETQNGTDLNSWATDRKSAEKNIGRQFSPPSAGLTTYRKRSELHGRRQDTYRTEECSEKDAYG